MPVRKEIRISGFGDHGVVDAGLILQEAAAIYDDLNAHHVQSYGPEARGAAARSDVIVSDGDIDYPKATQLDAMLATSQEAFDRYTDDLKPGGLLLVDEDIEITPKPGLRVLSVPIVATANGLGERSNWVHLIGLGLLVELTGVVSKAAIEAAVRDHVPRGDEENHLKVLALGYRLGAERAAEAASSKI
jgi:2-oxoglutarate ferredoxin oxidoreductase subunit gamma